MASAKHVSVVMKAFEDDFQKLSPIRTFDPAVFEGDDETPQSVCDFVLALCLIHNDCKDAIYAYDVLQREEPHIFFTPREVSGTHLAMESHVVRTHLGLIHELLELIKRHTYDLETPTFRAVRRQMPDEAPPRTEDGGPGTGRSLQALDQLPYDWPTRLRERVKPGTRWSPSPWASRPGHAWASTWAGFETRCRSATTREEFGGDIGRGTSEMRLPTRGCPWAGARRRRASPSRTTRQGST